MNSRHKILDQQEYRSFWAYWNHGYQCSRCRPQLCQTGQALRIDWQESLEVLESYEDGDLLWLVDQTIFD